MEENDQMDSSNSSSSTQASNDSAMMSSAEEVTREEEVVNRQPVEMIAAEVDIVPRAIRQPHLPAVALRLVIWLKLGEDNGTSVIS